MCVFRHVAGGTWRLCLVRCPLPASFVSACDAFPLPQPKRSADEDKGRALDDQKVRSHLGTSHLATLSLKDPTPPHPMMSSSTIDHVKAPVPMGVAGTTSNGTIDAYDGLQLHFVRYHPPTPPQHATTTTNFHPPLSIVFVHGFAEHVGRYSSVFPIFAARGIELICFDQRGFGATAQAASGGFAKHYTNTSWPQQFKDVQTVVVAQRKWLNEKYGLSTGQEVPIFLLGHSMGGGISAAIFTRDPGSKEATELQTVRGLIKGVVASSPWLLLTKPPPAPIAFLAPHLIRWIPSLKYPAGLQAEALTRDEEVQAKWKQDPLIQNWVKAVSALGPMKGGKEIVNSKWQNWEKDVPILIVHGEDDMVTSHKASKTLVEKLQTLEGPNGTVDAKYIGFPQGRHEMMFEVGDVKSDVSGNRPCLLGCRKISTSLTSALVCELSFPTVR